MDYTLTQLFKTLIEQKASDLHISAGSPPRLRIDGQIIPLNLPPLSANESQDICYGVLTENQKKVLELNKEIDLAFAVKGLCRFRANIYWESGTVAGAFRSIPNKIYSFQELNLPPIFETICSLKRGLVLITGPTGSGKTTTLASVINHINEHRCHHIVTIEDPIEYVHHHKNCIVNQRELGQDTNSFGQALKSVLRQDPDIIVVGEMRDLETISSVLTLAETGHLVFGTLHTNSAVSSINRLVDAFPPHQQAQIRTQIAMTLEAVFSQILIPLENGGRVSAMEIMVRTSGISALITEGKINQIYSSIQSGQASSQMQTMSQAIAQLVSQRQISKEQALEYAPNQDEMNELLYKLQKPLLYKSQKPVQRRG